MYFKKCATCHQVKSSDNFHKAEGQKDKFSCYCKSCTKIKNSKKWIDNSEDHDFKLLQTLRSSKHRAAKKNIENTLTLEDLQMMYPTDNKCPILGINLSWGMPRETSPSLDRIDPSKGYTYDNCQIISNRANTLKNNATLEELENIVRYLKEL